MSVAYRGIFWGGGGLNVFFLGPKRPPSYVLVSRQGVPLNFFKLHALLNYF